MMREPASVPPLVLSMPQHVRSTVYLWAQCCAAAPEGDFVPYLARTHGASYVLALNFWTCQLIGPWHTGDVEGMRAWAHGLVLSE